jgi:cyclopropane fatty-acyl-phospholipid synthase-like methyltransferase
MGMISTEESVVAAMDGTNRDLYPFIPYILQDLWEIGSDPEVIITLINKHVRNPAELKILDLGCGKGAVSVRVSEKFGCHCHGIDAVPEFIEFARGKAKEYGVQHRCTFETGDIRKKVKYVSAYDMLILGSIGPVYGDFYTTLTTLSTCLSQRGLMIIDDGYLDDKNESVLPGIPNKTAVLKQIHSAGMQLLDEHIMLKDDIKQSNDDIFAKLQQRCHELIQTYPDQKQLFLDYIRQQETENAILEDRLVCSAMLIGKNTQNNV